MVDLINAHDHPVGTRLLVLPPGSSGPTELVVAEWSPSGQYVKLGEMWLPIGAVRLAEVLAHQPS